MTKRRFERKVEEDARREKRREKESGKKRKEGKRSVEEDDKLSWLVGKDDGRNGASLKYREQSPSVATVTISNSPAFHLFFIGEKFVDLAVRNARNTLEEARKWGRVDDGGGGGGGGDAWGRRGEGRQGCASQRHDGGEGCSSGVG